MKKTFILLLLIGFASFATAQQWPHISFKENPPNQPPAIFAASMPPCLIGVAQQYGAQLQLTELTMEETKKLIAEAHKAVPDYIKKVRALELGLMVASREERYEDYEKMLRQLSEVKVQASLFHESLVKKARKRYAADDLEKLDEFIFENKEVFLTINKLGQ